MSPTNAYGLIVLVLLLFIAGVVWFGFIGWIRRKGWREPKERIEEGPRNAPR